MNRKTIDKNLIAVGRIKRAVGLKGQVLIRAFSQLDSILKPGVFFLKKDDNFKQYTITSYRIKKEKEAICSIEGVQNRTQAEAIEKTTVFQTKALLPQVDENEFYWYQLKGLNVVTIQGKNLGTIEAVLETGATDVLVVRNPEGEFLIPMVQEMIVRIDEPNNTCTVSLPPGLEEATFTPKRQKRDK